MENYQPEPGQYPEGSREHAARAQLQGADVEGPNPVEPATGASDTRTRPLGQAGGEEAVLDANDERRLELREEQLVVRKELRQLGEVRVRTEVEEIPGRVEVDAYREEVEVEHVPVGRFVSERQPPWQEGDVLVVPVYEEQLVVVKRLLLREQLRVRRVGTTERQVFQDTLRRERLVIEDPNQTGLVREQYPSAADDERRSDERLHQQQEAAAPPRSWGGFFENLVRRALQ